jgi:hypothetical protein
MRKYYIDFDGVILDTIPVYKLIYSRYKLENENNLFRYLNISDVFSKKREINNSLNILKDLQDKIDIKIITKVNNDYEARVKKDFLKKNGINIPVITVPQYEKKSNYVKNIDKNTILIDDLKDNIDDWIIKGGTGILFKEKNVQTYHCEFNLEKILI